MATTQVRETSTRPSPDIRAMKASSLPASPKAVIADIRVDPKENCFPMIPSGAAHNEMLLGPQDHAEQPVSENGMVLV